MPDEPDVIITDFDHLDDVLSDPPLVIVIEIGARGDLTAAHAASSAQAVLDARKNYPDAELSIMLDGFNIDQRELWEIPEARAFVVAFVDQLIASQCSMDDLNLDDSSQALLAICCGFGKITGRDPKTGEWMVEFQTL